jgi:hypothetical protein
MGNGDNQTLTMSADSALGTGSGAAINGGITHIIVCPGNVAGDATVCASVAINDVGWGMNYTNTADNVSRVMLNPNGTSNFAVTLAGGSNSFTVQSGQPDNVTDTAVITQAKNLVPTLGTAASTASQLWTTTVAGTAGSAFSSIMDSVVHDNKTYYLSAGDNGTLFEDGTLKSTNIFGHAIAQFATLSSDGTNMVAFADNGTRTSAVNLTVPATPTKIGAYLPYAGVSTRADNRTTIQDTTCGAVGSGRVVLARGDNTSLDNTTGIFVGSSAIDNTTAHAFAYQASLTGAVASLDNDTMGSVTAGGEGTTGVLGAAANAGSLLTLCDMVYAGDNASGASYFYLAIDNQSETVAPSPWNAGQLLIYQIIDDNINTISISKYAEIINAVPETITIGAYRGTTPTTTSGVAAMMGDNSTLYVVVDNATTGSAVYMEVEGGTHSRGRFTQLDVIGTTVWGSNTT